VRSDDSVVLPLSGTETVRAVRRGGIVEKARFNVPVGRAMDDAQHKNIVAAATSNLIVYVVLY